MKDYLEATAGDKELCEVVCPAMSFPRLSVFLKEGLGFREEQVLVLKPSCHEVPALASIFGASPPVSA